MLFNYFGKVRFFFIAIMDSEPAPVIEFTSGREVLRSGNIPWNRIKRFSLFFGKGIYKSHSVRMFGFV